MTYKLKRSPEIKDLGEVTRTKDEEVTDILNKLIQEEKGFDLKSLTGKLSISKLGQKRKTYILSFCEPDDNTYISIGTISNIKLLKKFFGVKHE